MPIQPNCPTAGKTEREGRLQRLEAVASASSSGMCARSAAKRLRAFAIAPAARPSPPAHARWLSPSDVTFPGSIACVLPEMHPVFAPWGWHWPRSGLGGGARSAVSAPHACAMARHSGHTSRRWIGGRLQLPLPRNARIWVAVILHGAKRRVFLTSMHAG
jgi:hypothetical protein